MCLLIVLPLLLALVVGSVMVVFSVGLPVALLIVTLAFLYWAITSEEN